MEDPCEVLSKCFPPDYGNSEVSAQPPGSACGHVLNHLPLPHSEQDFCPWSKFCLIFAITCLAWLDQLSSGIWKVKTGPTSLPFPGSRWLWMVARQLRGQCWQEISYLGWWVENVILVSWTVCFAIEEVNRWASCISPRALCTCIHMPLGSTQVWYIFFQ